MKLTIRTGLFLLLACSMGAWISSGARAGESVGACNASAAKGFKMANQIKSGVGDLADQCNALGVRLSEFAVAGCFVPLEAGELAINRAGTKGNDPETLSPLGETLCSALVDVCGFGELLPPGFCSE